MQRQAFGNESFQFLLIDANILEIHNIILKSLRADKGTNRKVSVSEVLKSIVGCLSFFYRISFLQHANVIFFPTDETHVVQQVPVAIELLKRGDKILFISNKKRLANVIPKNMPFFYLSLYLHPLPLFFKPLKFDFHLLNGWSFFRSQSKSHILYIALSWIFKKVRPSSIVVGNDLSLEGRLAIRAFNSNNTYCIQHGGVSNPLHVFSLAGNYFTFGDFAKASLISIGVSSRSVIVSGAPYLESIQKNPEVIYPLIAKLFPKHLSRKLCLILLSGPGHSTSSLHNQEIFSLLMKIAKKNEGVSFLMKLHNKDSIANYRGFEGDLSVLHHFKVITGDDLEDGDVSVLQLISSADCLVTGASASVLEGFYFDTPVFTFDLRDEFSEIDFIKAGVSFHIKDREEGETLLTDFFSDRLDLTDYHRKAKQYSDFYFYKGDKAPSQIIANHLISV